MEENNNNFEVISSRTSMQILTKIKNKITLEKLY